MPFFSGDLVLILCLIIGSALVILEAFIPGFGVAGISGIVLEVIAIYCAWQDHGLVFSLLTTLFILLLVGFAVFFSYRSAMKGRLSKSPLILKDTEETAENAKQALGSLIGQRGVTATALRPGGSVAVDGQRVPASSRGEFLSRGQAVTITAVEGDHVLVEPV